MLALGQFLSAIQDLRYAAERSRTPVREDMYPSQAEMSVPVYLRRDLWYPHFRPRSSLTVLVTGNCLSVFAAEKVAATATPRQIEELRFTRSSRKRASRNLAEILRANTHSPPQAGRS